MASDAKAITAVGQNLRIGSGLTQDSHGSLGVRVCDMRKNITVEVSAADRVRPEAVVADRNRP